MRVVKECMVCQDERQINNNVDDCEIGIYNSSIERTDETTNYMRWDCRTKYQMRVKCCVYSAGCDSSGNRSDERTGSVQVREKRRGPVRWLVGGSGFSSGVRLLSMKSWVGNCFLSLLLVLLASVSFVPCWCQSVSVTVSQDSYEVTEGEDITLLCNYDVTESNSDILSFDSTIPHVTWTLNGATIAESSVDTISITATSNDDSERLSIVYPASLQIRRVIDDDAGEYTCQVRLDDAADSDTNSDTNSDTDSTTLTVLGTKPVLLGLEEMTETSFEVGTTLQLECQGFYPLVWSFPENIQYDRVTSISRLTQIQDTTSWEETNVLTIEGMTSNDTGLFSCAHYHHDEQLSVLIYIYATNLSDANSLFLPTETSSISIFARDELLIPCRVTTATADITLIRPDNAMEEAMYVPEKGFLINGSSTEPFQGTVQCRASYQELSSVQAFQVTITKTPTIQQEGDVVIQEKENLTLLCEGALPVIWTHSYSSNFLSKEGVTIEVTTLRKEDGSLFYQSMLFVLSANYDFTGTFSCFFLKYNNEDDPSLVTSVYVYVSSQVVDHIFLPLASIKNTIEYNTEIAFTVPCRISNPSLNVTYQVAHKKNQNEYTAFQGGWKTEYDPKTGFFISPKAGEVRWAFSLIFTCITELASDKKDTQAFILTQEGEEVIVLEMDVSQDKHEVIENREGFILTCMASIPIFTQTLANALEYNPKFAWTRPGEAAVTPTQPDDYHLFDTNEYIFTYYYSLEIEKATQDLNGIFTCYTENVASSLSEELSVTVLDKGYARVQLDANRTTLQAVAGQSVSVNFQIAAYPEVEYSLMKGLQDFTSNLGSTAETNVTNVVTRSADFSNVLESEEGNYTLTVWNEYANSSDWFYLEVLVPPHVNISSDPVATTLFSDTGGFFIRDTEYMLTCQAHGKPTPSATWSYMTCSNPFGDPDCAAQEVESWVPISTASTSSERVHYSPEGNIATLSLQAQDWKTYRCQGSSDFHQVQTDINFKIIDGEEGIMVTTASNTVYVNETITIECRATHYLFNQIDWTFNASSMNSTRESVDNSSKYTITATISDYSYVSSLTIININKDDSGDYECIATGSTTDHKLNQSTYIHVADVLLPFILTQSSSPQNITVDRITEDLKVTCEATGNPIPELSLYRLQNNERVDLPEEDINITATGSGSVVLTYMERSPEVEMSGVYVCAAENRGGEATKQFFVQILEEPDVSIEVQPSSLVSQGDNVTIICSLLSGIPTPTVRLRFNTDVTSNVISEELGDLSVVLADVAVDRAGTYICDASNSVGSDSDQMDLIVEDVETESWFNKNAQTGVITGASFIFVILLLVVWKCHRRKKRERRASRMSSIPSFRSRSRMMSMYSVGAEDPYENLAYNPRWEFPRDRLTIGTELGKGAFGKVLKAVAVGIDGTEKRVLVAVKQVKAGATSADRKALWIELKMLGHIGKHINVVNFLGACTRDGPVLAIVEYCCRGNLLDFLRSKRKYFSGTPAEITGSLTGQSSSTGTGASSFHSSTSSERRIRPVYDQIIPEEASLAVQDDPINGEDLLCYSFQVARGMEFLASKQVVHRDLAARNVLLTENYIAKICDFGLARHLYDDPEYVASGKQGKLPIKWMALESIFDKSFTTYSDVWAYGVFLWEVFSLGGSPYPGIQIDETFYNKIKNGYRMNAPDHAPSGIYDTMLECWNPDADARPSFTVLSARLGDMLEANVRSEYIELNVPYEESNKRLSQEASLSHENTPLLQRNLQNSLRSASSPKVQLRTPSISDDESDPLTGPSMERPVTPGVDVIATIVEEVNELEENGSLKKDEGSVDIRVGVNGRTGYASNSQNTWL